MSQSEALEDAREERAGYAAGVFYLAWAALGWAGLLLDDTLLASLDKPGRDPGPALLPVFASTALTLGGLWFLVAGLVAKRSGARSVTMAGMALSCAFVLTSLLTAYWIAKIGFAVPIFAFAVLWLVVLARPGTGHVRRIVSALALSAAIVASVYLVFVVLLRVPLP